jgi:hypothetical protein
MKAFPNMTGQQGMDLRDYFAAKAMKEIRWGGEMDKLIESARECYMIADAMMKAREVK